MKNKFKNISDRILQIVGSPEDTAILVEKNLLDRICNTSKNRIKLKNDILLCEEEIERTNSPQQKELIDNKMKQMQRSKDKLDSEFALIKNRLLDTRAKKLNN